MFTIPYNYQVWGARRMRKFGGRALLADQMGLGKAEPLSSLVLTPDGWVAMGDAYVGMPIIGSDGKTYHVTEIHPQGMKDVFAVRFRDGAVVRCCDDHLWPIITPDQKHRGAGYRVMALKEFRHKLTDGIGQSLRQVPTIAPVEFRKRELPLHPYLVGYLLANGCLKYGSPVVTIPDDETINRLTPMLPVGMVMRMTKRSGCYDCRIVKDGRQSTTVNPLKELLRGVGVWGCGFAQKSIPREYLYSPYADRLALFQGLMDGDGSVSDRGIVLEYSTGSEVLARQVVELVQSFGGVAMMKSRVPYYTYKGERKQGSVSHQINISLPNPVPPFLLSRKANAYKPRTKYQPTRIIREVIPYGREECQCITVDSPDHLYVTDGYILTHNSLSVLLFLERHPELRPAIVVCPATLKFNWEAEAAKHCGWRAEVLGGTRPPTTTPLTRAGLYVINYDILGQRASAHSGTGWLPYLGQLNPKAVILDECQAISSIRAKRTKWVRSLCRGVPCVLALSGTPLTNRPSELFSVLNLLRPDLFPAFIPYANRYCAPRTTPWGIDFSGSSNLAELHQRLRDTVMIRRTKEEVLSELPPLARNVVTLPLSDNRQYLTAQHNFVSWLIKHKPEKAFSAMRAQRLSQIAYLRQLCGTLKIPAVVEWVRSFLEDTGEKLVLFGVHREVVTKLWEAFKDDAVMVHGGTPLKDREWAVRAFQNGPKRVFIGNVEAAGKGLTLTAASTVAFAEMGWSPGTHAQAEKRCDRIGQTKNVQVYYLCAKGTYEERLAQLLQEKQSVLSATLDGGPCGGDLDVFDLLCDQMQQSPAIP